MANRLQYYMWNTEWQKNTSRLHTFIPSPSLSPPEMTLTRPSWVRRNRLRSGVGLFRSTMHKWGLVPSANCRCGAEEQTADHILPSCTLYHPPNLTLGLMALDDDTVEWRGLASDSSNQHLMTQNRPIQRKILHARQTHIFQPWITLSGIEAVKTFMSVLSLRLTFFYNVNYIIKV